MSHTETAAGADDTALFADLPPLSAGIAPSAGLDWSLDALLNQLQGNTRNARVDPGIARFGRQRLNTLAQLAHAQSQHCMETLRSLTRVMAVALTNQRGRLAHDDLAVVAAHLHGLVQGYERWRELAENADFYRDNREDAALAARRWLRAAQDLGEWPPENGAGGPASR